MNVMMKRIKHIIVHCSASNYGSAKIIDTWHRRRGWKGIGYHFVINNGRPNEPVLLQGNHIQRYEEEWNGKVEIGRPLDDDIWISKNEIGAHALGLNDESIGVCLIGDAHFTSKQLYVVLPQLLVGLMEKYEIPWDFGILGHYEVTSGHAQGKTCPNIDMAVLRRLLKESWGAIPAYEL
jgi:hypothetical protein